ncbi:heat shock 70 kDa protein 17 [Selaginella moellendorffii]|nr:heat shock 70 kDa protein 17 [Selaginella moellendorffii]|eukprot:XP_002974987.2 heat shock 70 kDa protein 17 [Selaginella moellendorffii]
MRAMRNLVLPALLLLFSTLAIVQAAVFSVDLGAEWMKVAVVDVKPGQSPIGVALNEMSKRKSSSVVAFSGGNRLLAEEAMGIAARFPERVYSRVRDMVGKPSESVKRIASASYLPYDFVEESPQVTSIRVDSQELYRSEELLGMILGYCRGLAEANVKATVKDAVITVPPYFGQSERQAVIAAAQAAGINVLSLMNEHAAAALQYGIDKDFSTEPRYVLFYDMGANSAFAAVVLFSSYSAKEYGKNVSHNYFELKGIRWDAEIGGQNLELRLVEHFAKEFEKKTGVDVRAFPKAVAKLKKQAKRAKEILSANTEASFFVDSLYDDQDFKSHITRQAFEELCSDLWERAVIPLQKVLEDVGMTSEQLYAVELLGGGTRVPKLQQVLAQALGKKPLERHLDADEAITLGAALYAANISDGIKLNRKIGMFDGASYGVVLKVNDDGPYELVVPRLRRIPVKLARAVKQQEDYELSLHYDPEGELPLGIIDREIAAFKISGVTDSVAKYSSYNLSAPIKSVLHFALSRSGVLSLDRAETVVEFTELVEVPVNVSTNATTTLESTSNASVAENVTQAPVETIMEKKLKKKTIRIPSKLEVLRDTGAYSEDQVAQFRSRLDRLKELDDEKRQTEEAKNNLESYIYTTKEMLDTIKDLSKVSTEKQRQEFLARLDEAGEWLYSDGEAATASEFKKRLGELKAIGDPIFFRLEQLTARPAAMEAARGSLVESEAAIHEWKEKKPWISDAEVRKEGQKLVDWIEAKESEQAKVADHEQPAFSSTEVYARIEKFRVLVARTGAQKAPKPPKIEEVVKNDAGSEEPKVGEENPGASSGGGDSNSGSTQEGEREIESPDQAQAFEDESSTTPLRDEL